MTEDEEVELVEGTYEKFVYLNPLTPEITIHALAEWSLANGTIDESEYIALMAMPDESAQ